MGATVVFVTAPANAPDAASLVPLFVMKAASLVVDIGAVAGTNLLKGLFQLCLAFDEKQAVLKDEN